MKQKIFSKKANAAIGKAITVITAVVLGGAMMVGGAGVIKHTVMPTTTTKVNSMFGMSGDAAGGSGGTGGGSMGDDVAPVTELKRNGTIPEGGTYTSVDRNIVLSAGDNFPDEIWQGDIYEEGDYEYGYGRPTYSSGKKGWVPRVKDTSKTEYGPIISEIANIKILGLGGVDLLRTTKYEGTFENCVNMTVAPSIPDSVIDMENAFKNCKSLVAAPELPVSLECPSYAFEGCTSLEVAPTIPANINDIVGMFKGCTALVNAPVIPEGISYIAEAFDGCSSLSGKIEVNTNPDSSSSVGSKNFIKGTQITAITGSCSQATKDALMATK